MSREFFFVFLRPRLHDGAIGRSYELTTFSSIFPPQDHEKWNNAGCVECRSKSDFSELPLFRDRSSSLSLDGVPRATRVCERCLAAATPWVRHDFECRVFRCRRRLVPSDVVEYKRGRQFGSSPLNVLPEDGLVAIAGYLSGAELRSLFQVRVSRFSFFPAGIFANF